MRNDLRALLASALLGPAALAAGAIPAGAAAPAAAVTAPASQAGAGTATAVLAGGCFWGMEDVFERLRGVRSVEVGYTGGKAFTAHYEMVSTGLTGQAESVRIAYDPKVISYATLLNVYFRVAHDPTTLNRQGDDVGSQYRSEIFYADPSQKAVADATIAKLTAQHAFAAPIVTQVAQAGPFYPAEAYHQHYADLHPDSDYIRFVDDPKVAALDARFADLEQHPYVAYKG